MKFVVPIVHLSFFSPLCSAFIPSETLVGHGDNLPTFVEAFVRYFHLHRGARTFINSDSWAEITSSDLKPLLFLADVSKRMDEQKRGSETSQLEKNLNRMKLNPSLSVRARAV